MILFDFRRLSEAPMSWHLPLGPPPLGLLPLGLLPHGLLPPPGRRFLCRRSLGRDCPGRGLLGRSCWDSPEASADLGIFRFSCASIFADVWIPNVAFDFL